jgi:hypothetical protein
MPPIAHAADWLITIPTVLLALWLVLVTVRDRRRRRRNGADSQEGGSQDAP